MRGCAIAVRVLLVRWLGWVPQKVRDRNLDPANRKTNRSGLLVRMLTCWVFSFANLSCWIADRTKVARPQFRQLSSPIARTKIPEGRERIKLWDKSLFFNRFHWVLVDGRGDSGGALFIVHNALLRLWRFMYFLLYIIGCQPLLSCTQHASPRWCSDPRNFRQRRRPHGQHKLCRHSTEAQQNYQIAS